MQIGYLFSREDLISFFGSDFGLPEGSYTALPTVLLLKLGLASASLRQIPNFVLDPSEYPAIEQRLAAFDQIIKSDANQFGLGVADLEANTAWSQEDAIQTMKEVFPF